MKRSADGARVEQNNNAVCFHQCIRGGNANSLESRVAAAPNKNPPTSDEISELLASDLGRLSILEQQRAFEEFHGIAQVTEEDSAFVGHCLSQLETAINKLRKKPAYEKAAFLSPKYVKDGAFRLMFLRAEEFDVQRAARRINNHFEFKQELFGQDKLVKDITANDLNEDDGETLLCGCAQILPQKDAVGRPIVFFQQRFETYRTCRNLVRDGMRPTLSSLSLRMHYPLLNC
jgi:hypothetical protein